jgi:hypothetical protein
MGNMISKPSNEPITAIMSTYIERNGYTYQDFHIGKLLKSNDDRGNCERRCTGIYGKTNVRHLRRDLDSEVRYREAIAQAAKNGITVK